MVRVPGSLGDSGFHREFAEEDVQVKKEPGDQASSEIGSTTTLLNEARSADRQSPGRSSADRQEEGDPDPDLEEKPRFPPQVPSGTPADLDSHRDLPNDEVKAKPEPYSFTNPPAPRSTTKKKKSKAARKKLKAPESDAEDRGASALLWNEDSLEYAYHRKNLGEFLRRDPMMKILIPKQIGVLKGPVSVPRVRSNKLDAVKEQFRLLDDSGLVAGAFEANELFDLDLDTIHYANRGLFDCLKLLLLRSQTRTALQIHDVCLWAHPEWP
ncbi:hypothetical protein PRIC2_014038 [Phytophthora ramorum]